MHNIVGHEHSRWIRLPNYMLGVIPLVAGMLGVGYALFEQSMLQGRSLSSSDVFRIIWFPVLIALVLWVLLTQATSVAEAMTDKQNGVDFQTREVTVLSTVAEVVGRSLDLDTILFETLDRIVEVMKLSAGEIWMVEGDRLNLKVRVEGSPLKGRWKRDGQLGLCPCGNCTQAGEMIGLTDLPNNPSVVNVSCAQSGFCSVVTVPLKSKSEIVGAVVLSSITSNDYGPTNQRILSAVGARVATAIENAQLFNYARRRAMHLETASIVGQRVTALLDLDCLLGEVVELIRKSFSYYHTHILLVNAKAGELVLKDASGPGADAIKSRGLRIKIGQESITGWVAQTGQALLCNDVTREPRYLAIELVPETKAELAVPLCVGNRVVGVLDVQSERIDAFDQEDLTVLQILGNQVGIAIENARLFQVTKRRYEAMVALHETSLDMIAQLDTTQVLEALLLRGVSLLGVQAGSLFLYDPQTELIHNVAQYNASWDWAQVVLHPGSLTDRPLLVNDYATWLHKPEPIAEIPRTRLMSAPLRWKNHIIGGIVVANKPGSQSFTDDDLWLLSQFADLASIAVKNAELYSQSKQFSHELKQQFDDRTRELVKAKKEIVEKSEALRALLAKTIRVQEEERTRIARDMHDGVVQLTAAARYQLQAAEVVVGSELRSPAQDKFLAARELLDEIEKEVRHAICNLRPPIFGSEDLGSAIEKYVKRYERISGVGCRLEIVGKPLRLPDDAESNIYRLVEQALSNVAAHSQATEATVVLNYQQSMLNITVKDNGRGFEEQQWLQEAGRNGKHLGLLGMQERAQYLGGDMRVVSAAGCGTCLNFWLPIQRGEEEWNPFGF